MLGGNGFVGSHICKEALDRGLTVASLSRYFASLSLSVSYICLLYWSMNIYLGTVLLGTSKFLFLILVSSSLKVQGGGLSGIDSLTKGKDIALQEKGKKKSYWHAYLV